MKENQPTLYDAIAGLEDARWSQPVTETAKGHGRLETRTIAPNGTRRSSPATHAASGTQPARRSQLTKGGGRRHHDTQDQVGNSVIDPVGNYVIVGTDRVREPGR